MRDCTHKKDCSMSVVVSCVIRPNINTALMSSLVVARSKKGSDTHSHKTFGGRRIWLYFFAFPARNGLQCETKIEPVRTLKFAYIHKVT